VAACALTAVVTERREFLDVGLGLALIAFVATIAFAAFLEKKERNSS
jgi:multicomponent Na+:H+ antiporter subunit F